MAASTSHAPRPTHKSAQTNNWGLEVFGDIDAGTTVGPGKATYDFSSNPSLERVPATTYSSTNVTVNLGNWLPGAEQPSRSCPSVGAPVSVSSGNVFFDHTDVNLPALGTTLTFTRSYNSSTRGPGRYGVFGPGWSHNYERRIERPGWLSGKRALLLRGADGMPRYYQDTDNDGTYRASVPYTEDEWIVEEPGTLKLELQTRAGSREQYESTQSGGRLLAIKDAVGRTTTLNWSGGQLTSVVAPGGRTLTLAYDAGKLIAVDVDGVRLAEYGYSAGRLSSSELVEAAGDPRAGYQYESVRIPRPCQLIHAALRHQL